LSDAHELKKVRLWYRAVDFDSITGEGSSFGQGGKVYVGTQIYETRSREGAD
jgi:hypothetical protein